MNPAEIIATKLLGWERLPVDPPIYAKGRSEVTVVDGEEYRRDWDLSHIWPDLSDYNCIRRMEDALAERGLLRRYHSALWGNCVLEDWQRLEYASPSFFSLQSYIFLRATTEQRVAAALKVLEEADQQKTEEAQRIDRANQRREAVRAKAKELNKTMRCNCDLDNWEPEDISGHSHVCRIHKEALKVIKEAGL